MDADFGPQPQHGLGFSMASRHPYGVNVSSMTSISYGRLAVQKRQGKVPPCPDGKLTLPHFPSQTPAF